MEVCGECFELKKELEGRAARGEGEGEREREVGVGDGEDGEEGREVEKGQVFGEG